MLISVYGPESLQIENLQEISEQVNKSTKPQFKIRELRDASIDALKNLNEELSSNFLGSLHRRLTSEVLTDLIQLSRAVLDEQGDDAKNVASVLVAAAYEDVIRRMGSSFAGVMEKNDLSDVIEALKTNGILVAPQLGIALSYLNFRNRALHAN